MLNHLFIKRDVAVNKSVRTNGIILLIWLCGFVLPAKAQVVYDSKTGLTWQYSYADNLTWDNAVRYCSELVLDRYSDWRLPSRDELHSLVDYAKAFPATSLALAFPAEKHSFFWASTQQAARESDRAWWVSFGYGNTHHDYKSKVFYARCVRGTASGIDPVYTDNGDGTVTDSVHNLMWHKTPSRMLNKFQDANIYCFFSRLGGHSDWRLPTITELMSTVDEKKAVETSLFPLEGVFGISWSTTMEAVKTPIFIPHRVDFEEPQKWIVTNSGCTGKADLDNMIYYVYYDVGRATHARCVRKTASTPRPTATPTVRPTATPVPRPTATPTVRPTATPVPRPSITPMPNVCYDSDRGANPYEKGTLTFGSLSFTDSCDGSTLLEYYCRGNDKAFYYKRCGKGCAKGRCNN